VIIRKANVFKVNHFIPSMVRFRRVNVYGTRFVIELMKTDMSDLDLTVGDYVDIDDMVKKKTKKTKSARTDLK